MMTIKLIGQWARATDVFTGLPNRARLAARAAMGIEAERFRNEVKQGVMSGAPGGQAFTPLSALTLAIHGPGKGVLRRTDEMLSQIVVIRQGDSVGVTVRGARAKIADIQEGGRTFRRVLTPRQRRFLFAAMRAAGVAPRGGGTSGSTTDDAGRMRDASGKFLSKEKREALVGMTVIPARPFFSPTAAKYFRNQKAAERRILSDWQWMMGGKFKPR